MVIIIKVKSWTSCWPLVSLYDVVLNKNLDLLLAFVNFVHHQKQNLKTAAFVKNFLSTCPNSIKDDTNTTHYYVRWIMLLLWCLPCRLCQLIETKTNQTNLLKFMNNHNRKRIVHIHKFMFPLPIYCYCTYKNSKVKCKKK